MKILYGQLGDEKREAWFSDDEKYRYLLDITWEPDLPTLAAICLNPSTADHLVNDPTVVRCKAFARSWGFGTFRMLNAFALRATDPEKLRRVNDPIGPDNTIEFLLKHRGGQTVAGWGGNIQKKKWAYWYRGHEIAAAIPNLHCFRRTPKGHPEHPLYLPADVIPERFSYEA